MAMGTRKRERQQDLWIATKDVVETPANAFYDRLNQILDEHEFDVKVERMCSKFYKKSPYGRPSMAPGVYFRSLLIGYFEGLDSERGIVADGRLAVAAEVPGIRAGRGDAGPFHDFTHLPLVLAGDAQGYFPLGAEDPR
jgi:hypothetical protein